MLAAEVFVVNEGEGVQLGIFRSIPFQTMREEWFSRKYCSIVFRKRNSHSLKEENKTRFSSNAWNVRIRMRASLPLCAGGIAKNNARSKEQGTFDFEKREPYKHTMERKNGNGNYCINN
ncbi:hypothetical protein CDAR_96571 [Caerostris darwini]|uniref:Uncharacterized protein n=1 Tax=Caerostris darwini TaxID=1538125 RepID=A0AAV4QUW6_9ARAC|nr:hypothetical protein CDAR_96571 [Caerostris darwini]